MFTKTDDFSIRSKINLQQHHHHHPKQTVTLYGRILEKMYQPYKLVTIATRGRWVLQATMKKAAGYSSRRLGPEMATSRLTCLIGITILHAFTFSTEQSSATAAWSIH